MTRRAPTYLRQPGDGEGLMPRQASIILHMGVVKAPLCNSGLSVSHLTEVFETLPRCRRGSGMRTLPRRSSMTAGRVGQRKVRRLRWNTERAKEKVC